MPCRRPSPRATRARRDLFFFKPLLLDPALRLLLVPARQPLLVGCAESTRAGTAAIKSAHRSVIARSAHRPVVARSAPSPRPAPPAPGTRCPLAPGRRSPSPAPRPSRAGAPLRRLRKPDSRHAAGWSPKRSYGSLQRLLGQRPGDWGSGRRSRRRKMAPKLNTRARAPQRESIATREYPKAHRHAFTRERRP